MKFYVYADSLYHACFRDGGVVTYDNLYIFREKEIFCKTCQKRAPIAITMLFGLPDENKERLTYKRVGPGQVIYSHSNEPYYSKVPADLLNVEIELEG